MSREGRDRKAARLPSGRSAKSTPSPGGPALGQRARGRARRGSSGAPSAAKQPQSAAPARLAGVRAAAPERRGGGVMADHPARRRRWRRPPPAGCRSGRDRRSWSSVGRRRAPTRAGPRTREAARGSSVAVGRVPRAERRGRGHGGERGIRTLETVSRLHTFQACAFDHSATSPGLARTNHLPPPSARPPKSRRSGPPLTIWACFRSSPIGGPQAG